MDKKNQQYIYAVGKRKTAIATVKIYLDEKPETIINNKKIDEYTKNEKVINDLINEPLALLNLLNKYKLTIKALGGGKYSQAEAIRLAISRALVKMNGEYKKTLRSKGMLTRDPRVKERKKPGLKKARKAPQWSKR